MSDPHQTLLPAHALVRFVAGLTGLHLSMLPALSPGRAGDIRCLTAGCRAHARRANGAGGYSHCAACARSQLRSALAAPRLGHDFEGRCGVRTFLLPVMGATEPVGVLALRRGPEGRRRRARPGETPDGPRDAVFRRAVRLLRPLAREPAWRAEGNGHAAAIAYGDGVPAPNGGAARAMSAKGSPACEARSRQAVRALIKRVRREFAAPLELKKLARESGLNASYLSTVFAREVGLPFKSYLTALRLERAQVLLGDPVLPISRVAREVGYATPHRFRAAFRAWTGVSPGRWRAARLIESES
ncbi:MAG: hypothetical protein A2V88_09340 [Elusimicrobia bacterium RBG_16_66_12]|nr:MAG: hypothetical protein A2V88_09340 [Elusimicrobia bacterium RBG_16_66_12]